MSKSPTDEYTRVLKERLEALQTEIESARLELRNMLEAIKEKEQREEYIQRLLNAEGVPTRGPENRLQPASVSDMAYEVLARMDEKKPLHYREIHDLITSNGRLVPGKDPAANLVSHLSRDRRFIRTSRGIYGLAEWGLKPAHQARRRKPRKRSPSRGDRAPIMKR